MNTLARRLAAGWVLLLVLATLCTWLPGLRSLVDAGLALHIDARLLAPSLAHPFGTDALGRDLLAMLIAGAAVTLPTALAAVSIGVLFGVPLGLLAAARGGLIDAVLSRVHDVLFAFPALLLAVLLAASLGPGAATAALAIGLFNVPVFARFTRGSAQGLFQRDFVLAARLSGVDGARIAATHVWPNVAPLVIVQATVQLAMAVGAEAALAYVGLGVQPPAPSWGRLLFDAQTLTGTAPWLAIFPGLAIAATVLAFGVLGEALRERYDPRGVRHDGAQP